VTYAQGLVEIGDRVWAWLQPDGSWGWSNAGLVADGGESLLVDTLFDLELTGRMLEAMRAATPAAARIATVVNTHANGDHCYGNHLVADAEIIATRRAAEEMGRVPASVLAGMLAAAPTMGAVGAYLQRIFGAFQFGEVIDTLPTRTFDGSLDVAVGDTAVRLLELGPAHTGGDLIVEIPGRRLAFAGDLLFVGGHPIVWAGPVSNWVAALTHIAALDVDIIVPGHGPLTDRAGATELAAYFVELQTQARPLWEEGLAPLAAARLISVDRAAAWGDAERLVVNVAACFRDFAGDPSPAPMATLFADMAELAGDVRSDAAGSPGMG